MQWQADLADALYMNHCSLIESYRAFKQRVLLSLREIFHEKQIR